ncbi:MAG: hypothetical protein ACOY3I_06060 [Verrucomicrobiota bacterium]
MPFAASWIEKRVTKAFQTGRLAHAFLISGTDLSALEKLFFRLAHLLLNDEDPQHPDLHILRPESKSRRIVIHQVRELEHALQLKAHRAPYKVAGIFSADRMCAGSAEPANAFLKTLEEPPEHTIIFLLTDHPELLIPTIRSRCLALPLKTELPPDPEKKLQMLTRAWIDTKGSPADIAYRRAVLLAEYWRQLRDQLETALQAEFKQEIQEGVKENSEEEEAVFKAHVESQFILLRDRSIAYLITQVWERAQNHALSRLEAELTCESFDDLRLALSHNMDQSLAIERACLKINRLI